MLADVSRDALHKLRACRRLWHTADIAADQQHSIASVAIEQAMVILRLRRAAINDGNEIISYDDAVLAFLSGVLGYAALLDYFHRVWEYKDITR